MKPNFCVILYFRTYVHAYLVVVNVVLGRNGTFLVSKLERRNLVSRPYSQIRRWTSFRLFYWKCGVGNWARMPEECVSKNEPFFLVSFIPNQLSIHLQITAKWLTLISTEKFKGFVQCATSILSIRIQNRLSRQPQLIDREGTHVSWEIMGPQLVSSHIWVLTYFLIGNSRK